MKPPLRQRLDSMSRRSTPVLLTVALVVLNMVPLHVPGFSRIVPVLPLMAVYHWAVYRPHLMPPLAVFLIGLLQDVLSGAPLGVNAVVFLSVYGVVVLQQKFFAGKSFLVVWLGFALIAAGAAVESWLLVSVLSQTLVGGRAVAFQYILNLGFFPLIAWLFVRWQQAFLKFE